MRTPKLAAAALTAVVLAVSPAAAQVAAPADRAPAAPSASLESKVDQLFVRWTASTPGCAVGVDVDGKTVLSKAYGMADLEHDIRNRPDTIFEAGSVSKQFTAAAIMLLARDGKLSLDDPARKYLPELPAHTNEGGTPLTIRQMLTHTSGLRDWGSVAGIGGWPRTSRAYTHAHVLDIVSRQRALNFTPGTRWSYSNSGYNLAAVIVSRVSGQSFADFTRTRIFEPLGMTRTSWRDDFTRVVKDRAMAYEREKDGYHTLMPFENVHGNGGLLTTVGDLLKWNENFGKPIVGDAAFVTLQEENGRFTDGRAHGYGMGLQIGTHKGEREISHGGATAGYRAFLTRLPDAQVSVALLCNAADAMVLPDAHAVADLYVAGRSKPASRGDASSTANAVSATHTLTSAEMDAAAGLYRETESGGILRIVRSDESKGAEDGPSAGAAKGLRLENGPPLFAQSASRFLTSDGLRFELDGKGGARLIGPIMSETYERMMPATPTADQLASLAGVYVSDEAEVTFTVEAQGDTLALRRRPDAKLPMTPLYADAFRTPQVGTVVFERDASGRVVALRVVQDRVWNLHFTRQAK